MKVERLQPFPNRRTRFAWPYCVTVPEEPGGYALVAHGGEVLYVGLATGSIRGRMKNHLDTQAKRAAGVGGAPFWFYYVTCPAAEVGRIERGWMNQSILEDGAIPLLNKVYSPI